MATEMDIDVCELHTPAVGAEPERGCKRPAAQLLTVAPPPQLSSAVVGVGSVCCSVDAEDTEEFAASAEGDYELADLQRGAKQRRTHLTQEVPPRLFLDSSAQLGEGGVGNVVVGHVVADDRSQKVAVKLPKGGTSATPRVRQHHENEAAVLRFFRDHPHPNVMGMAVVPEDLASASLHGLPAIVMPCLEGGDLFTWVQEAANSCTVRSNEELLVIAKQLLSAMAHIHAHGYLHLDLSLENIVLDADGKPVVSDFGSACKWAFDSPIPKPDHVCFKPSYRAPEMVTAAPEVSRASDMYAVGVVLFILWVRKFPYPKLYQGTWASAKQLKIMHHAFIAWNVPVVPPDCVCRLIVDLMSSVPESRPTAQEALARLTA